MNESERIGDWGETIVEGWCNRSKLYLNDSRKKDRKGWDLFIEWPDNYIEDDKSYTVVNPLKCLVQVKTSQDPNKSWNIELSNYKHLIDSPLPTFITKITLDENDNPINASLIEIDKNIGIKFLESVKKLDGKKLNQRKMVLDLRNEVQIDPNDPKTFRKELENIIGHFSKYIESKAEWKKEIGYQSYEISFDLNTEAGQNDIDDTFEQLIDFDLGIIDELDVKNFGKDVTWKGLNTEDINADEIQSIRILESNNQLDSKIVLSTSDGRKRTELNMQMVLPSIFGRYIPPKYHKYKFTAEFITFIVSKHDGKIDIQINGPEKENYQLKKFLAISKFYDFLSERINNEIIIVQILDSNGGKLFKFKLKDPLTEIWNVTEKYKPIKSTQTVFEQLNISLDTEINLKSVIQFKDRLNLLAQLFNKGNNLHYKFNLLEKYKDKFENKLISLIPFTFSLGSINFWCIISITGNASNNIKGNKEVNIENGKLDVERYKVWTLKEYKDETFYQELLDSTEDLQSKYKDVFDILIFNKEKIEKHLND